MTTRSPSTSKCKSPSARSVRSRRNDAARTSTYADKKRSASDQVREHLDLIKNEPQPELATLHLATLHAFHSAIEIAKMARLPDSPSARDFVGSEVDLVASIRKAQAAWKRADVESSRQHAQRWPKTPGISFGWIVGDSALDVAYRFAEALWGEVTANQHESWDTRDALVVSPEPDRRLLAWRDRALHAVRERILTNDFLTTLPIIHRDADSLAHRIWAEYERALEVAAAGPRLDGPHWFTDQGRLYLGGELVTTISGNAGNQATILDAFEEANWAERITCPFEARAGRRQDSGATRRQTIKELNKRQSRLKFSSDGRGGVVWEKTHTTLP